MIKVSKLNIKDMSYELENGVILYQNEWNGETYTVKTGKEETTYRPVQIHNEEQDTWETIGFEVR